MEFRAPIFDFLSRPDIRTPRLFVDTYDVEHTAPGYIFMSPFSPEVPPSGGDTINYEFGPTIYDNTGVRYDCLCDAIRALS
jgi:hypothetical protein